MFKVSKSVLSFGAGAIALGVLMLAAPRTAHAIAATLVQLTNTVANPAITQSANSQAGQIVQISTEFRIPPNTIAPVQPVIDNANGVGAPPFTVPPNVSLVITSADVTGSTITADGPCVNADAVNLTNGTGNSRAFWILAPGQGTSHFTYPSGIVFPSGTIPYIISNNGCYTWVQMQGYYTAN
jgi:hypothetical protein